LLCACCLGPLYTVCCWKPTCANIVLDSAYGAKPGKEPTGKGAKPDAKKKSGEVVPTKKVVPAKKKTGKVVPMEESPTPAADLRIKMLGEDRRGCYEGATLDLKSCHYGQVDNLVIPFCQIYNGFVEIFNGMFCFGERVKLLQAGYRFEIVLDDLTERPAKEAGWKDETADFFGRIVRFCQKISSRRSARRCQSSMRSFNALKRARLCLTSILQRRRIATSPCVAASLPNCRRCQTADGSRHKGIAVHVGRLPTRGTRGTADSRERV